MYLASCAVLHGLWRRQSPTLRPVVIATVVLIALGVIGTFPTFFQAFTSEWRAFPTPTPTRSGSSRLNGEVTPDGDGISGLADAESALARMARRSSRGTLEATRRSRMEVLWTTVSYAVFASGAVLALYILVVWLGSGRH